MKFCPQCHEQFEDEQLFCDLDGSPLVDDISMLRTALQDPSLDAAAAKQASAASTVATATIGILVGIVLCLLAYIGFIYPNQVSNASRNETSATSTRSIASAPAAQIVSAPAPAATVSAEESPSPEVEPEANSQTAPASAESTAKATLNQGPISTGERRISEGRTLITMKDGSSVEADAAWEDAQGVWYRRRGLVSFVERAKVEKMSEVSSAAVSTDAPKQ